MPGNLPVTESESDSPLVRVHDGFDEEFPDGSALATECFLNLGFVATSMLSTLNGLLATFGVPSYTAFNAMTVLAGADGPLPPSVIAERMVVTRPRLTGILDSLEQRGLVTRRPHGSDGRMRLVALTPDGVGVVEQALPEAHRFEAHLFGGTGPDEQAALMDTLTSLAHQLASWEPGSGD